MGALIIPQNPEISSLLLYARHSFLEIFNSRHLKLSKEAAPRLEVVRNTKDKKADYFGPFPDSGAAYDMAKPVLSNMANGTLQNNMIVEVSPTWDGRNKKVAYMECFGRLMAGIAPWLALPDDDTEEGKMRHQLREWALKSYANAVDPQSPDYLLWNGHSQALVDAAYIAESFIRAYDQLWVPLDETTKQRYIKEFSSLR